MRSKELKIKNVGNKLKTVRGITLITLAITIILLIILAGVVINVTIGKNGIINRAKSAKEKYEIAQIREKIELEILNVELKEVELGNEVTIELVLQELLDNKTFDTIDKEAKIGYIDIYEIKLKYNETNKVVIEYIKEWTGLRVTYSLEPSTYTKQEKIDILLKVQGKVKSITKPDGLVIYPNQDIVGIDYYVTANGTYTFIIENEEGKKEEKNVIVDIIDRIEPKPFEITAQTTRTGGIKITANAEDEEANGENVKSGIGRYEYYVKNATESEYTKYDTNEIISLPSGTYKVYAVAYDKAGNSTQSSNEAEVEVEEWLQIWNEEDLRNIANNLSKNYIIMQDIELTQEWTPLGTYSIPFKGQLEGNNHKITGLFIESEEDYQGLFGYTKGAKISNLDVECNISGNNKIGAIAGQTYRPTKIENVKVSGTVIGNTHVGGLVGSAMGTNITKAVSSVNVSGASCVGGLIGEHSSIYRNEQGTITNSYSIGEVSGCREVGGLVGRSSAVLTNVYSISKVTGTEKNIGGLVGYLETTSSGIGLIENVYAKGNVTGIDNVGGLVGINVGSGVTITNAYSTGEVNGNRYVGGLVGSHEGTASNTYTISKVEGNYTTGGLIGGKRGTYTKVTNSYWSKETSEVETSSLGTELTLEEMKNQESYEGWDFESGTVWVMKEFPELIFDFDIEE